MAQGHGHVAEFREKDNITILLLGTDDKCKCLVGNKIIQLDHFHPGRSLYQEISLELQDCVVTVINIQKQHFQQLEKIEKCINLSSEHPCIVFVLQPDYVTQSDVDLFKDFLHRPNFGKKMLENMIVLLFSAKNKRSAKPGAETDHYQQYIVQRCRGKSCDFNPDMESNDLMNRLMKCWKIGPEMRINKYERSHRHTCAENEQEEIIQKLVSGAAAHPSSSGHRQERSSKSGQRRNKSYSMRHIGSTLRARLSSSWAAAPPSISDHWTDGRDLTKTDTMTIVLLGQTGSGKSATGNTILRKSHFESHASSVPVTQVCQMAEETVCGKNIRVIDTPDFFYEGLRDQHKHIRRCLELSQPGPDAYVLVMELGRFTDGERKIVHNIQRVFGEDAVREIIILFTRKEKLGEKTVSDYIRNTNPHLQELARICGSRCLAFNNNDRKDRQFQTLLEMVSEMKRQNGCTDICVPHPRKESTKKDCTIM